MITLTATRDAAQWDELVAAHPGASMYHDWAWLDLQADLLGIRVDRLLAVSAGTPVGVVPLPRRARPALDSPNLPFPFVGPLVPASLLGPTATAVRRYQRRHGPLLARLDLCPADATDRAVETLRAAGFEVHEDSTVVVDTSHGSLEELHRGYSRMRKRNVRRARDRGAVVRPARPGEFTALIPALLDEAYGGRGVANPYPAELGARFESWAAGRDDVWTWIVTVEDEPAGSLVMLGGHPTAIAWVGGCLREFRDASPNALIHEVLLEHATSNGFAAVDFSGWVDDQVGEYKLGFGGERRPYLSLRSSLVPPVVRQALRRARPHRRHD